MKKGENRIYILRERVGELDKLMSINRSQIINLSGKIEARIRGGKNEGRLYHAITLRCKAKLYAFELSQSALKKERNRLQRTIGHFYAPPRI